MVADEFDTALLTGSGCTWPTHVEYTARKID
jgi:hypothetical protein